MPIPRPLSASLTAAALLAAVPTLALGHAELVSSVPAPGASLTRAPTEVVITFDDELDPDGSELIVTDADGAEVGAGGVDLEVAERNVLRATVSIDANGAYEVSWTAVSRDGHAEVGSYVFEVRSDAGATSPNTALPTPVPPLGVVLLLTAALVAGIRAGRRAPVP